MIAETITAIIQRLTIQLKATSPFNGFNLSPSLVSIWSNFISTFATEIKTLQELMNIFQTEIETVVEKAIPGTASWIRSMALKFQYDASNPQAAQINSDFSIGYPTIDSTLQIVKYCAVVPYAGIVNIKVAKGTTPTPLAALELTAFQAYTDLFMAAGSSVNIISVATDIIRIDAEIFFNGQYASDMVAGGTVETAILNYLANLPFNGVVKVSDIEKVIMTVPGVTDVTFSQVSATPTGGAPINMILANTEYVRTYQTYSGSIANDPANPLATSLTYTVSNN